MKFFKSTLAIVAIVVLCATNSIFAARPPKVTKPVTAEEETQVAERPAATTGAKKPVQKTLPRTKGKPAAKVVLVTPVAKKTYPQLIAFVKSKSNVWDSTKKLLSEGFVTTMIGEALASNLDPLQLDALLQTARDYNIQMYPGQKDNIDMLQKLEAQRKAAIDIFTEKTQQMGSESEEKQ